MKTILLISITLLLAGCGPEDTPPKKEYETLRELAMCSEYDEKRACFVCTEWFEGRKMAIVCVQDPLEHYQKVSSGPGEG